MEFLTDLLDNSKMPWLTALLLGLMTAISPCPLATNITAIGFISKDLEDRNRVFFNGLFYTLGRAVTYTALAFIIFLGADQLKFSGFFQRYGEKIIGPLLIIIGLFMLDIFRINFPGFSRTDIRIAKQKEVEVYRCCFAWIGFCTCILSLQRCSLFRHACSPDYHQCIWIISADYICYSNRNTSNYFCMGSGLYHIRYRWSLQQDKSI